MYSALKIQQRLNQLGFGPLDEDGVKGPKTDASIVAFKRSVGLRPRPFVGPLTWAALKSVPHNRDGGLPWMVEALKIKGLHEGRNYLQLRSWFDRSVAWIDPREIPWCGAFVATSIKLHNPSAILPSNPLGARNWGKFGYSCDPVFGSVLTFWRGSKSGWKGHVGFYFAEDATAYHVLGGNQSNAVTIARVSKSRLLESRWPNRTPPASRPIMVTTKGQPLSTNEA